MKRLLVFLVAIVVLSSCNDEDQDLNKDISIPVSVVEVKPQSIEKYISTTGTVKPLKEVTLLTEINGTYHLLSNRATGKPYALGDKVKKGDPVLLIKNKEYQNNINHNGLTLRLDISKRVFEKQKSLLEKGGVTHFIVSILQMPKVYKKFITRSTLNTRSTSYSEVPIFIMLFCKSCGTKERSFSKSQRDWIFRFNNSNL